MSLHTIHGFISKKCIIHTIETKGFITWWIIYVLNEACHRHQPSCDGVLLMVWTISSLHSLRSTSSTYAACVFRASKINHHSASTHDI